MKQVMTPSEALSKIREETEQERGLHNMCAYCSGARTQEERCHSIRIAESRLALAEALAEITKGKGRFSRDQLEHASNTIEDMKAIAERALQSAAGAEGV